MARMSEMSKTCPDDPTIRIARDVVLGKNVKIHSFVNLYGCRIGDETRIGAFVEVQKGATIGRRCKISSHSFICEGVHIEDNCFVGHGVSFINDKYLRASGQDGALQTDADWTPQHTHLRNGASIGSGATILGGVTIGRRAIIGAGSVVTRDVGPGEVFAGNPACMLRRLETPMTDDRK